MRMLLDWGFSISICLSVFVYIPTCLLVDLLMFFCAFMCARMLIYEGLSDRLSIFAFACYRNIQFA